MDGGIKMVSTCKVPFIVAEVNEYGNVYTCCSAHVKDYCIGNIYKQSFEEVWNSNKAIAFREKILKGDYSLCNLNLCSPVDSERFLSDIDVELKPEMELPLIVRFNQDAECNINCVMCRKCIKGTSQQKLVDLNNKIEQYYLPMLDNAQITYLSANGDPFASRHYSKLTKSILDKYPNMKFDIHTNGLLCNKKNCDRLGITDKLSTVKFSVHAATKETYDKICKNSNFDKVMENLKWIKSLKDEGKLKDAYLYFVVSSLNYKEIPEFIKLGNSLGMKTFFWEFAPWMDSAIDYEEGAIYDISHPEHRDFVKVLNMPEVKDPNAFLNPYLQKFMNIDNIDNYLFQNEQFLIHLKNKEKFTDKKTQVKKEIIKVKNSFLENIFSIKNEYFENIKRKTITILGVKMKWKTV